MPPAPPAPHPRIIAHRGANREAPENTLPAFRAAVALGADGVEMDVQASADGVPVVIHDATLERTTDGTGPVAERTAAELARLEAGLWFTPPRPGVAVPSLAAALALLAPTALQVHLEIKARRGPAPELVAAMLDAVHRAGMARRVVLSSFNHASLAEARRLAPDVACAALVGESAQTPWLEAAEAGLQGLHPHRKAVTAKLVRECHARGLAVRPYTVDDADEALRLMALGVDGLITNEPARLLALRDGRLVP